MSTTKSTKLKINDVAKELNTTGQELADFVTEKLGTAKKPTASLTEDEMNYVLEAFSQNNQVATFDDYFATKNQPAEEPKAEEKPAEKKAPKAKKETAKKEAAPKADKAAAPKADKAAAEKPAAEKAEKPAKAKKETAKKEAAPKADKAAAEKPVEKKAEPEPEAQPKKPRVVIQSPFGGEITPEEIFAKIDNAETVYVRVDVNKAFWVNGEEYGNVDLW